MKNIFLLLMLSVSIPFFAQKEGKIPNYFSLEFELGSNTIQGDINKNLAIRNGIKNYWGIDRIDTETLHTNIGIKPQYTIGNGSLSFATGLRLHIFNTELEGLYGNKSKHYFFLKYQETDDVLKLARVESIKEKTYYLGIPLEIKTTPIKWSWLGFYIKVGAELGLKMNGDLEFNLLDQRMNKYPLKTFLPSNIIDGSNQFYSSIYSSLGFSITFAKKYIFSLETVMPKILTKNNITLREQKSMGGVQVSLNIPLNLKK
ncbi:MAG: hypothetical protein CR965_00335 [Paludibacter sp.]|nr:MAG: hypothetical protein CR965_00335 [Paludibacter sp.]